MRKGSRQEFAKQFCGPLSGLDRDVPGETVGDDDIDRAGGNVITFDEAVKPDRAQRTAQAETGGADRVIALLILRADVEQTDRGLDQTQYGTGKGVAQQRELNQVL